jgi:hypothetical protein
LSLNIYFFYGLFIGDFPGLLTEVFIGEQFSFDSFWGLFIGELRFFFVGELEGGRDCLYF